VGLVRCPGDGGGVIIELRFPPPRSPDLDVHLIHFGSRSMDH
jgi:hypothetical protein